MQKTHATPFTDAGWASILVTYVGLFGMIFTLGPDTPTGLASREDSKYE
jgi:hypothetical protein